MKPNQQELIRRWNDELSRETTLEMVRRKDDRTAAMAEYIAHTEVEPASKHYMDRMLLYVLAKYAANPAGPEPAMISL